MLRSINDILTYPIEALDGSIGKAKDCLFDDSSWTWRHLVVDTGKWLPGKKVLVSPFHLDQPDVGFQKHKIHVKLEKEQIGNSPGLDADAPVSRQYEMELAHYYNHAPYWLMTDAFHPATPHEIQNTVEDDQNNKSFKRHSKQLKEIEASTLRSANEVCGYQIDAKDGEFGFIDDLIMEDANWTLHYVVVSTRKWLPGRKFLIDIDWIQTFDWKNSLAMVNLDRDGIESSPVYDPEEPINRDYLNNLYDFYGRPKRDKEPPLAVTPL